MVTCSAIVFVRIDSPSYAPKPLVHTAVFCIIENMNHLLSIDVLSLKLVSTSTLPESYNQRAKQIPVRFNIMPIVAWSEAYGRIKWKIYNTLVADNTDAFGTNSSSHICIHRCRINSCLRASFWAAILAVLLNWIECNIILLNEYIEARDLVRNG